MLKVVRSPRWRRNPRSPAAAPGVRLVWLAVLCGGLPAVEALLLMAVGLRGSASLAPGVTAAAPYGMYHDLRFLLTYHSSWLAFALEAAAMIGWRAAIDGTLVWLAWPADLPRPGVAVVFRRTAMFAGISALLLTPAAATASAMEVMPVSDLFLGGMPVAIFVAALTAHGVATSLVRGRPPLRAMAWSVGTFAVVTAGGGVIAAAPSWAVPIAAAATGLVNARAWRGIVRASAVRPSSRPIPVVPLAMVAMAAIVIAGITIALRLTMAAQRAEGREVMGAVRQDASVLLINGFHSAWDGAEPPPLASGLPVQRFSYAGLDASGQPRPYSPQATEQPLSRTVRLLKQQVALAHKRTGRRIDIVADSEGALALETYLAAVPSAPVDKIVLLDPLVDPGRSYFPAANADGWGVATGAILRGLGDAIGATTPLRIYADGPFIRSVDDHGPMLQDLLACPSGRTRELVLFSLADSVASPYPARIAAPSGVVYRLHGYLLGDSAATRTITMFLRTGRLPGGRHGAADRIVRAAASAWQAPPLWPSLVPRWRGEPVSGCNAKQRALTAWLR